MDQFVDYVSHEYVKAKKNNPNYSLRAFAKRLQISPTTLSRILNGKRQISIELSIKILDQLLCSPQLKEELIKNVITHKKNKKSKKTKTSNEVEEDVNSVRLLDGMQESFEKWKIACDPIHLHFLALLKSSLFKQDINWMAKKLDTSEEKIKELIYHLKKVGLIKVDADKSIHILIDEPFLFLNQAPKSSIKECLLKNIEKSKDALFEIDLEERDHVTFSLTVNPQKINLAKTLIEKFITKLNQNLNDGNASEVYSLNIQLFPVTNKKV